MDVLFTFVFFVACVIMTNSPPNFSPVFKYIQFSISFIFLENFYSRASDLLQSGLLTLWACYASFILACFFSASLVVRVGCNNRFPEQKLISCSCNNPRWRPMVSGCLLLHVVRLRSRVIQGFFVCLFVFHLVNLPFTETLNPQGCLKGN